MSKKKTAAASGAPAISGPDERNWKAESDARTLCEAEAIKADAGRVKAASGAAKKMAKDKMVEASAMRKIAGGKMSEQARFEQKRIKAGAKAY